MQNDHGHKLCNRPIILPKSMKMLLFVLVLYLHFIKPCEQREPILVWAQLLVLVLLSCRLPLHQGNHHDVVTIMMSLSHNYLSFIYIRGFSAGMLNILSQSLRVGFLTPYCKCRRGKNARLTSSTKLYACNLLLNFDSVRPVFVLQPFGPQESYSG
mgnify:CR=1 FL=1